MIRIFRMRLSHYLCTDADVLAVIDEDKLLLDYVTQRLLRASLNSNIDSTPVAVCMTRMPHYYYL